ncbi:MAG: hypothetical protein JWM32_2276 [Verrucomicrobia bacterium]|nr:hypothetical protein [Verrucomicrobiota bacterium]
MLLIVAWLVPFLVHLAPWSGARPLGAYLLPMFWTTLVAVYFFGAAMGLVTGLFAPAANLVLTGLPAWKFLSLMSIELAVFAFVMTWAVRVAPRFWPAAPLAYLAARAVSTGLGLLPLFSGASTSPTLIATSLARAGAGLVILAAINFALVRFYPKSDVPAA